MITPDDLDTQIRNLIDLAGADSPPGPRIAFSSPRSSPTSAARRDRILAAAIVLIVAGTAVAITAARHDERTTRLHPADTITSENPTTTPMDAPVAANVKPGDRIATLEIPKLDDLTVVIYAGVGTESLSKGAGHLPSTPSPGELGNAIVEGQRTTYGQDFIDLDQLAPGDRLIITTSNGHHYEYTIAATFIDAPTATLDIPYDPNGATLTLYTCHPKFSSRQRLTIYAKLDPKASDIPGPAQPKYGNPTAIDDTNALPC